LRGYETKQREKKSSWTKKNLNLYDLVGCIRKTYYALKNFEEQEGGYVYPYGEIIHGIGNVIHDCLQNNLSPLQNELKTKINDMSIVISGRVDMLWNNEVLVEIKSIDALPNEPKKEHMLQALYYVYLINTYMDYDIKVVQMLYVSRGKVGIKIFDVDITPELLQKVGGRLTEWVDELSNYMKLDVPPPRDHKYVVTDSCRFCGYKDRCESTSKYKSV